MKTLILGLFLISTSQVFASNCADSIDLLIEESKDLGATQNDILQIDHNGSYTELLNLRELEKKQVEKVAKARTSAIQNCQ